MSEVRDRQQQSDQPSAAQQAREEQVDETITIPLKQLLQCYRQHLDSLHQLTSLLGTDVLADFAPELIQLAELVGGPFAVADAAPADNNASSAAQAEIPESERPEIKALLQAVQRNPDSIRRMTNLPEIVLLAAVERMGTAIKHIPNPSEAVQLAAVKRNPWSIKRIKHPTAAVIACALEGAPELKQYFARLNRSRHSNDLVTVDAGQHE